MKPGELYFMSEEFFYKYDPHHYLSRNKSDSLKRPYVYAFQDKAAPEIHWMVPISSQYAKYEDVAKKRLSQFPHNRNSEKENALCLGNLNGEKKVFLIQNMIPVTESYVESKYLIKGKAVVPDDPTKEEIIKKATRALEFSYSGHANLLHSNVHKLRSMLLKETHPEKSEGEGTPSIASEFTSVTTLQKILSKEKRIPRLSSLPKNSEKKPVLKKYHKNI